MGERQLETEPMTDQKADKKPITLNLSDAWYEKMAQLEDDINCTTGQPEAETPPAIFLCQVCDQTPERGHAPDCPGATVANQPAETPPLLTPDYVKDLVRRLRGVYAEAMHIFDASPLELEAARVLESQAAALRTAEQKVCDLEQSLVKQADLGAHWARKCDQAEREAAALREERDALRAQLDHQTRVLGKWQQESAEHPDVVTLPPAAGKDAQ
jgi:hypothetical protein